MTFLLAEITVTPVDSPLYWFAVIFVFVLGASIGSFLNVVAYRVPARISLVYPGSRCPKCNAPIRALDNLPIVAWLKLGGRCRDCQQPISGRYPLVELITAMMFFILAVAEPLSNGVNLPTKVADDVPLWGLYAYHIILLASLLAQALIELDGHRPPRLVGLSLLAIGLLGAFQWPQFLPMPAHPGMAEQLGSFGSLIGLVDAAVGCVVGAVMGCLMSPGAGEGPTGLAGRNSAILNLACVGVYLGWQATAGISAVAACIFTLVLMYRSGWRRLQYVSFNGCLWVVTFLWIASWSFLATQFERLGEAPDYWKLALSGAVVTLVSWVGWRFSRATK